MHTPNPFAALNGSSSSNPQDPPPGSLCPFLGAITVPLVDQGLVKNPRANPFEAIQMGVAIQPCVKEKCRFWDMAESECYMKRAAHAQLVAAKALEEVRNALVGFFGARR
jgi:hypothetical protein